MNQRSRGSSPVSLQLVSTGSETPGLCKGALHADCSALPKSTKHVRGGETESRGGQKPWLSPSRVSTEHPDPVWFWAGTLDAPSRHHKTLTIWLLTVFLDDLVDPLVQVFVLGGYLKGEPREETCSENTAVCYSEFKTTTGLSPSRSFHNSRTTTSLPLHSLPPAMGF